MTKKALKKEIKSKNSILKSTKKINGVIKSELENVSVKYGRDRRTNIVFEEDIVPSGVAELSHLQQQGYTYIKP